MPALLLVVSELNILQEFDCPLEAACGMLVLSLGVLIVALLVLVAADLLDFGKAVPLAPLLDYSGSSLNLAGFSVTCSLGSFLYAQFQRSRVNF